MTGEWKTVLVTGGIGSGKSSVCDYLSERGVPVYDSDSRTKTLYDTIPSLVDALERSLGENLRGKDGLLDKKKLASVIFSSQDALSVVEGIVHPAVIRDFLAWKSQSSAVWGGYAGNVPFVVMESAVALAKPLFSNIFDASVIVTAPESVRIERVMRRDSALRESVISRIRSQEEDVSTADAVIENDFDISVLRHRCDDAFEKIVRKLSISAREVKM